MFYVRRIPLYGAWILPENRLLQILKRRLSEYAEVQATPRKDPVVEELEKKYKDLQTKHKLLMLARQETQQVPYA